MIHRYDDISRKHTCNGKDACGIVTAPAAHSPALESRLPRSYQGTQGFVGVALPMFTLLVPHQPQWALLKKR